MPVDKVILAKWLKAGYLENRRLFPTEEGTPQGGICSPVMANMALDGLERLLAAHFPKKGRPEKRAKVNLIRYADDFCITGSSKELLEQEVKPLVEQFLSERGLQLSSEKTVITHIEQGFDFLGQTVRKYTKGQEAKPYDPAWEPYFEKRLDVQMVGTLKGKRWLLHLWKEQGGLCPVCQQKITKITGWHSHHVLWRSKGGSDRVENRVLLHPTCHHQVHSQGLHLEKPRPVTRAQ